MAERGLTFRALAARTRELDPEGKGLSRAYLGNVVRGADDTPSARALRLVAQALEVPPEHFAEYRLAIARSSLDESEVGLAEALRALGRMGTSNNNSADH